MRLSAAARKPAPFIKALYPPPEAAIPIFGNALALFWMPLIYEVASKPEMFILERNSLMGAMVLFLRIGSHAVSLGDKLLAALMVGRSAGQETSIGAYPPEGEFGSARSTAAPATARESTSCILGEASRGTTTE